MPNRKDRFKPRADAGLLSALIQQAWGEYQDSVACPEDQARVAEAIASHFEKRISPSDFEVLSRWKCISFHERANVAVYDAAADGARYCERFGIELPRKIPVVGNGGYGYPSMIACEPSDRPDDGLSNCAVSHDLDPYFAGLLTARKAYQAEYKASGVFPQTYKEQHGMYPTWGEIEDKFPVLGDYLKRHRETVEKAGKK